ncbi:DUF6463 family protein [Glycomyces sp. TRM65418]|uniref:DUF6463 family protein n=1 Tax=Glycomyces sp. TRM65418 TaxID=2867006 RepID=UPI001CE53185|nr:DUF6463 family protein [Glycomyces sp. TRM65418]MCC3764174.1 DUF6463 family protein [Glycomyces sp. TRM65418]QZD53858.1 hypothetical protein K3N28_13920 [Glycomyces sp. TRM65418]
MIAWAGRIFVFLGIGHTVLSLALVAPSHAAAWFGGVLWRPDEGITEMSPGMAAYWLTVGGFGLPLLALGFAVLWMHRRGIAPPAFLGWTILAWTAANTVILLPSPWILGVVASVLYLAGVRRAARGARAAAEAVPAR